VASLCAENQLNVFSRLDTIMACERQRDRQTATEPYHILHYAHSLHMRRAAKNDIRFQCYSVCCCITATGNIVRRWRLPVKWNEE